MEPNLHTVYFICGNLPISIEGGAYGTVMKKVVAKFSLCFMSHKWNTSRFFRNRKCKFSLTRPRHQLLVQLSILFHPELQNGLIFCSLIEYNFNIIL